MTRRVVWTRDRIHRVGLLRAANVPTKEIASLCGVSAAAADMAIHAHHRQIPRRHLFYDLPPEVVEWLIEITPADATIADTVRSILVDAHADETS